MRARALLARRELIVCALKGEQTGAFQRDHLLDPVALVDGDGDDREVLGQRQEPVCAQVLFEAEPEGAAEEDAGGDIAALVEVGQPIGKQSAIGAVAFPEVAGELEAVLVHGAPDG